jgi:hypothetical protein
MKTCPECQKSRDDQNTREEKIELCGRCLRKLRYPPRIYQAKRGKDYLYVLKARA